MTFAVCLIPSPGDAVSPANRQAYARLPRSRGLSVTWRSIGSVWVMVASDPSRSRDLVMIDGDWVAIGDVRIDNRPTIDRLDAHGHAARPTNHSDLALALSRIRERGVASVGSLLGDFAFVVVNSATGDVAAAVDAFALHKLYVARHRGLTAFATRAEALAVDDEYEKGHLAALLMADTLSASTCVYRGVAPILAGTYMRGRGGEYATTRYWSAQDYPIDETDTRSTADAAAQCRHLLAEGLRPHLDGSAGVWAQLSGGMDSTSITSLASWLYAQGQVTTKLTGAITYVDRSTTASDERRYAAAVASRWNLRHESIVDPPVWIDETPPPYLDHPESRFPYYPRDRRLCDIVSSSGARILLTGFGSDELFLGNRAFFADLIAKGRWRTAWRTIADFAVQERRSFWSLAWSHGVKPLLPRSRGRHRHTDHAGPTWITPSARRNYGLAEYGMAGLIESGRAGRKYWDFNVVGLAAFSNVYLYQAVKERLDVRHPFLYRPLVEWALRLPAHFCMKPHASKWILREAMRGILPEMLRARVGTGGIGDIISWSFATHGSTFHTLLREPVLGDLGLIDVAKCRAALESARTQRATEYAMHLTLLNTLTLEAWLQRRSDRWPTGNRASDDARETDTLVCH